MRGHVPHYGCHVAGHCCLVIWGKVAFSSHIFRVFSRLSFGVPCLWDGVEKGLDKRAFPYLFSLDIAHHLHRYGLLFTTLNI